MSRSASGATTSSTGRRARSAAPPSPPKQANAPAPRAHGLGDWVGAGKAGKIFQNPTTEAFVDSGTQDSLELRTRWTLAEFASHELGTDAVMEVRRTIHVQLARGAAILVESRARSWFYADRLPNDVYAALHAPAKRVTHDGSIVVADDRGLHLLRTHPHPHGRAPSLAVMLAGEPMLGFATPPEQCLREARHFVAHTVPRYDENMLWIESVMRDAPAAALGLREHIKVKLSCGSPPPDALSTARHTIARIKTMISHATTGYEGTALLMQLAELLRHLAELLRAAKQARPADKALWDHVQGGVQAIGKAVVGLGVAVKEIAFMARDLGLWGLDAIAGALGANLDWAAASSIGKAYQAGKSTGEIFTALVDGVIDRWSKAIEHAENGDLSLLMDLGAELALDLAIVVATAGAATPGVAATRARTAARALELTHDTAAALARRAEGVVAKTKAASERAPAAARRALLDSLDVATGLADGLRHALQQADTGVGPKLALLDPGAIPRAIQHVRGARAIGDAKAVIADLRDPAVRAKGQVVIAALEQLAEKAGMPDAISSSSSSSEKIWPGDTQWAIAGKIAVPVLEEIGRRLPEWLHGNGQRVVTGEDGFAALLVFGGHTGYGDDLAAELARRGPVYLLDFDDEAPMVKQLTGARTRRLRVYPSEFLKEHGIIAPGYEPSPPSPVISIGVVEGITPEEARRVCPKTDAQFTAHPRGVLV
ncbi:MAG TPA: hypothetical protein VNO30_47200, partial [Kofleriaceae bacterium]|nr:hypothetical protein [Kofleriaceae bacterium]